MKLKTLNKLIFFIVIVFILIFLQLYKGYEINSISARNGLVDIPLQSMSSKKVVSLNGQWEFYWMKLLEPKAFRDNNYKRDFVDLPGDLTKKTKSHKAYPENGYATLRLNIKVPDTQSIYGLKFDYFASANNIWINGKLVSSSGKVGKTENSYIPQYIPQEIFFKTTSTRVDVVIQIANFHHRRIRLGNVLFGTYQQIMHITHENIIKEGILTGSLLLIAVYYAVLYFIQRKNTALFHLAFIAFLTALRESIIGERILLFFYPNMPGEIMMKLGYMPVFLILPLIILYVWEVFKYPRLGYIADICEYSIGIFASIVLIFPVKVYDLIFQYSVMLMIFFAVYLIYIVLTDGYRYGTKGAYVMSVGMFSIFICSINDVFREFDVIRTPELFSLGIVVFVVLQAMFLAWKSNDSFEKTTRLVKENQIMYKEIQELNEDLENKVRIRTKELKIANSKLDRMSKTDPLTELNNRRYFDAELNRKWNRSIKLKVPISIIMMDIDFFKEFNDNYGHMAGDKCLKKVSNTIKQTIKNKDGIAARYGGEEFVVVLSDTDIDEAFAIAQEIRINVVNLKIKHKFSDADDYVTMSFGVNSLVASKEISKDNFINDADKALYISKKSGRNCVHISGANN